MKKVVGLISVLILLILVSSCFEKTLSMEVLFQERATDWFSDGDAEWKFVNGELTGSLESGAGFVMTKKSYSNFILELEFNPDNTINSGVFIRCKNKELSFEDCYEVNIWDLHPKQENRTGAIVSRSSPLKKVNTLNKWNTYKIINNKDHLQVWINDVMTIDLKDKDRIEGPIALQAAESGKILFRNVRLTPLVAD
jgi:hypothetical protein